MADEIAIAVQGLRKVYQLYAQPADRLKQFVFGRLGQRHYREFAALDEVSFELRRGEVLGIVGRNGAGKSTLLQLICGTLTPSAGTVSVRGRVAALLELGAGFNMEFSGRENIYLNAAVLGLTRAQVDARYDAIVDFAELRHFIDQPVKTYSSGMYMRLAFAIATSVDPDILVIDEALSVGDGAFARKSFDRIMQLKEGGATILFCSHALFQVEALCGRALWLEKGRVRMNDLSSRVIEAYGRSLEPAVAGQVPDAPVGGEASAPEPATASAAEGETPAPDTATPGYARFRSIVPSFLGDVSEAEDGLPRMRAGHSELRVDVAFSCDPDLPPPVLAYEIQTHEGYTISSAASFGEALLARDARGDGQVQLVLPRLPLMRGRYRMNFYLASEQVIHFYDHALVCVRFEVVQDSLERGVVFIPHEWRVSAGAVEGAAA